MFNSIITELYEQNVIKDIIVNFKVDEFDRDDLEQEVYQILLEYDSKKIIDMYRNKQLKYFLVGIIQRQYHSKTSPFYKKYKKYYSMIDANMINKVERNDEVDYYD